MYQIYVISIESLPVFVFTEAQIKSSFYHQASDMTVVHVYLLVIV